MKLNDLIDHLEVLSKEGYGDCRVGYGSEAWGFIETMEPKESVMKIHHPMVKIGERIVVL